MSENKAAAIAAELTEAARLRAHEIGEAARAGAEAAFARAQSAYSHGKDAVEDGIDHGHRYLKRQWNERPVAVAATAVGFGVLVGLLLSKRR
jgi:ElaB/YqjD/DUF883 family membrane-anchored ribosome-binding protein